MSEPRKTVGDIIVEAVKGVTPYEPRRVISDDPLRAGHVKVIGHDWDQDERHGLEPYRWRVTFELELVNGWGIVHALDEIKKYIESGRGT